MKRPFLLSATALLLAASCGSAATQEVWENDGSFSSPPFEVPMIDARNFINNGLFFIDNVISDPVSTNGITSVGDTLFSTANTLNFINRNQIGGTPGFEFETYDSALGRSRMASSFINAGSVSETNCSIYGSSRLLVWATNIVNRGTLSVGADGLLRLQGDSMDLDRGLLLVGRGSTDVTNGIYDTLWGIGTNDIVGPWTPASGLSYPMQATAFDGQNYQALPAYVLNLANGYNAYIQVTAGTATDFKLDVLLLANDNPNIPAEVRFAPGVSGARKAIRWESIVSDRVTGALVTNYLFFRDNMPYVPDPTYVTNFITAGTAQVPWTLRPTNYFVGRVFPAWDNYQAVDPGALNPALFQGTNTPVTLLSTAYKANVSVEPSRPNGISSVGYSNLTGRIELIGNKVLDLAGARIQGPSFLMLKATNHFAGAANAEIFAPFSSLFLATTNQTLSISNLLSTTVPQITGDIECWSARWTNANASGTVLYNVTMVHSALSSEVSSMVEDLHLRGPEVVISDVMNVAHDLLLDCERLTITTNEPGSLVSAGELNLAQNQILWAPSFPRLQYLTNWGTITTPNAAYFAGARTPPWYSGSFEEAYQAFVNHGTVTSQGNRTWAHYFENSGWISSGVAGFDLVSDTCNLNNGTVLATNADINLASGAVMASNLVLNAGRAITLRANGYLNDGSLDWGVEYVTNRNTWVTRNGLNLPVAPLHGSLLATTVTNIAYPYANVISTWAGVDRGKGVPAFVDNCALGRLILDGGNNSTFTFAPASGNNALYVDSIEFKNYAAAQNSAGDLKGVRLLPGMKIYFAQAIAGGVSVAEKLNGRNNGQFVWVSNYAGYYSSTNLVYPDGSTNKVNAALAISCTIDSNGNGTVNCLDPAPIPAGANSDGRGGLVPPGGVTGGDTGGGTGSTNGTDTGSAPLKIETPAAGSTSGITGFVGAKGAYYGLCFDTNGVASETSGYLSLAATKSQGYSARLCLGGKTYVFTGRFANDGRATNTLPRKGLSALTVKLQIDLGGMDVLSGQIGDGSSPVQLFAGKRATPANLAGTSSAKYFTWRIPPDVTNPAAPAGSGYGTVRISASGNITWKTVLADGTTVSQTTALQKDGYWPLYAAPYNGKGLLLGWLHCEGAVGSGDVVWIKPPVTGAASYAAGFTNHVESTGSAYSAIPRKRSVTFFNGYGKLILTGGGLSAPLTNSFRLLDNNTITNLGPSQCVIKLVPGTGAFHGSLVDPTAGKISFNGTLLQSQNLGAGFFLGTGGSGQVVLQSPGL